MISIMISFHFIANRRKNFIHGSYIFRWWIFFCLTEKKIHAFIDKKTYCSDRILNTVLASVMGGWRVLILVINHVISIFFEVIIWRNILEIISNRVYLQTGS